MIFKSLEEKCLYYRGLTDYRILPNSYILVMLDGRSFSQMVKNKMQKPFDGRFVQMMNETAKYLCERVQGCKLAYVQSDEISLLLTDINGGDVFFGGRLCKMQSIIASMATAKFNQLMTIYHTEVDSNRHISTIPLYNFDCKVWCVPNANDAFAWFLYRQIDCVKNSKQQVAQTYIPHKELVGKTTDEQIAYLLEKKGINWENDFTGGVKYGRFIVKQPMEMTTFVEKLNREVNFTRDAWTPIDGFPLTEEENAAHLKEIVNKYQDRDIL